MINIPRLLKVVVAWMSMVYIVCFGGVAIFPGIRANFMQYALHLNIDAGENILTISTFLSGLVIWNFVAILAFWLFAALYNAIKE